MQNAQTQDGPDLRMEDWPECYGISEPESHKIEVVKNCYGRHIDGPLFGWPRLWLMAGWDDRPEVSVLWFDAGPTSHREGGDEPWNEVWEDTHPQPLSRAGTWRRYLEDIAFVKAFVQACGWTATDEERALLEALDARADECPIWVRRHIAGASRD